MERYYDLEISILSCILQKPDLMKETRLEDKYFVKHKKLWLFMKAFYQKFGTIDLTLMYQIIRNKYQYMEYLTWMIEVEPSVSKFKMYEDELIKLYEQKKKEKEIINEIFKMANDLLIGNIGLESFKNKFECLIGGKNE